MYNCDINLFSHEHVITRWLPKKSSCSNILAPVDSILFLMNKIDSLINHLKLEPHPEGGWYAETYRSRGIIPGHALPEGFVGYRNFCTAIYFLLPANTFSAFHRILSDECWHFYEGAPVNIYVIKPSGELEIVKLGKNVHEGEVFQAVVPAGCWFASQPVTDDGFSLVGCTVSPGFEFADFELADGNELSEKYPAHEQIIRSLTR